MARRIVYSLLFLLFAAYCVGYLGFVVAESLARQAERNGSAETRAKRAAEAEGPIKIGAAADWRGPEGAAIWNALSLAANEINAGAGAAGRKILLARKDDGGTPEGARRAAQLLADDPDVVAVIGHGDSNLTLAASRIYDHYGVLLMSPAATAMNLTRGSAAAFRLPPGEEEIARTLADYCAAQGLKRVMILYEASGYGQGLANAFEKLVDERGLAILDRIPYDASGGEAAIEADLESWKRYYRFDAILLAGPMPEAGRIAAMARARGVAAPILAGCELDTPALIEQAGAGAEGVVVASVFDAESVPEANRAELEKLSGRLGGEPVWRAVRAYDALKILAAAIDAKKSAAPDAIAGELRSGPERTGIAGKYRFNVEGDSIAGAVWLKIVKGGKFERLPAPAPFVAPPAEGAAP